MQDKHQRLALSDVLDVIIDHRGKTPTKLGGSFSDSGVRVLSAKNVVHGRITDDDVRFVSRDMWDRWMPVKLRSGDVLLTSEAPLGQVAILKNEAQFCLGQRLFALRANPDILDPGYLFYALQSRTMQQRMHARATGTTAQGIRQSELLRVDIDLPPLPSQRAIAHTLGSLDDKIELNRRMNETLEAIARTLFESWFVNFDPVRAKAEGRQPVGIDAETAALFPDGFEDSPLGDIPRGWKIAPIGDLVQVVGGSTPRTTEPEYWDGGTIKWATPKDLAPLTSPVLLDTARGITREGLRQISSGLLPIGTVLLSSRAPVGYLAVSEVPVAVNQGFIAMVCSGPLPNLYVLQWAKANLETVKGRANGTTFLEVSKANFRPIPALIPPQGVLSRFMLLVEPLHNRIVSNLQESQALAQTRDELLPKLLSGEACARNGEGD